MVKDDLKNWARNHYQEPEQEKRELDKKLATLHESMESLEITEEILFQERGLVQKLHNLHKNEEEKWRLESISIWLQSGDKNTKLFHKQAKSKTLRNNIKEINSFKGHSLKKYGGIKQEAYSHFKNLYTKASPINVEETHSLLQEIPSIISAK